MTITLYFLQASRCIRTAWQLEELDLDYEVEFSPRVNKVAPPEFKKKVGDLGKFPTLVDNGVSYFESGNIAEYLEDKYDKKHKLLSADEADKYRTLRWVHASEATYMLHAIPVIYVTWFGGEHEEAKKSIIQGLSKNIVGDLTLLEDELNKSKGKFLLGDQLTIADITVHFSVQFMLARGIDGGKKWPRLEQWLKDCESTEGYKKAVKKTGYDLSQSG
ncbi:glutathione S-transferase [Myriangium duriaei CBS 260.36]|uniref:Glutathione S-transferase n=1 Tax=Myriangium duriaei CBS 260.36 TaxID=1168546 RepID=A0A9P4ME98_9PEZI|nr:glutathione S-transferase [Myriangium duriaei CBS 260.36]